jgi:uncharacterized LabA/DUF88 family protein
VTTYAGTLPPATEVGGKYAIMVDAGYLYAAAGEVLFGTCSRRSFRCDADKLIRALISHANALVGGTLLRIYWYDAARDKVPTFDQRVIAQLSWVKLRMGNLNGRGQQKGVDSQLREDMERLARQGAVSDLVLLAGEEDLVPGVEEAQSFGVLVHLWGVEPPYGANQAERLVWECDDVEVLDAPFVQPYFTRPQQARKQAQPARAVHPAHLVHAAAVTHATPGPVTARTVTASPLTARTVTARTASATTQPAPEPERLSAFSRLPRLPDRPAPEQQDRKGPAREQVEEAGEHVAHVWIATRGRDNIGDLLPGPHLPPVISKDLLIDAEKELGLSLRPYPQARSWLRAAFWNRVYREFGIAPDGTSL